MIRVYRLSHRKALEAYPDPFRPKPTNNRWNTERHLGVYTSEHLALVALELLAYWRAYASLEGYQAFAYRLDEGDVNSVSDLDPDLDPKDKRQTQAFGDSWLGAQRNLALKVPSVIIPNSYNYLINPNHKRFSAQKVEALGAFHYDERLLKLVKQAKATI